MSEIKPINKVVVHQICSGQVILDLATAVKELVENSLDAGATCIEIKLKEYGLEQVEVVDNGHGVEKKNFEALTLKHHTSKLRDFSDLGSVETFGFRGEALSSLCALCDVTVCTKHINSSVAYKIEYDNNGLISSKTHTARQPGTTVTLRNIFSHLPVRHKEFKKNIKKEYSKVLVILSAYCIISRNVKLTCCNQTGKGKSVVLSTQASSSIHKNIASIYGTKQLQTLKEFVQVSPSSEVCQEYRIKESEALEFSNIYSVTGMISNPVHGNGRSTPDRQFYFINSRPVELPRLSKIINEVYHSYNRHQHPFVVLNIEMKRDSVDVNVTPDKRKVFLEHEKLLLALVKTSLINIYEQDGHHEVRTIKQSRLISNVNSQQEENLRNDDQEDFTNLALTDESTASALKDSSMTITTSQLSFNKETPDKNSNKTVGSVFSILDKYRRGNASVDLTSLSTQKRSIAVGSHLGHSSVAKQPRIDEFTLNLRSSIPSQENCVDKNESDCKEFCNNKYDVTIDLIRPPITNSQASFNSTTLMQDKNSLSRSFEEDNHVTLVDAASRIISSVSGDEVTFDCPQNHSPIFKKKINFSMEWLRKKHDIHQANDMQQSDNKSYFRARIDPGQNTNAESELSRNLSKESFLEMIPIGQFNHGFIIVKYRDDLFIIDQHATDEIYNFERLQQSTKIHTQNLVVPQKLELTASDHMTLLDNMTIFQQNGFDFMTRTNEEKEITFLTKVPMSKNWEFGSSDVEELIFMLADAPGVMCRPSRMKQMFASRACRKSIMIGTALTLKDMSRLVEHMSEINHPWNCPHGRPTMRHLIDLSKIFINDIT